MNRLRPVRLLGYAAPAAPYAALYFPVFVFLAPFYAAERGVSLAALGALFIGARLIDAFSDPLMGWVSDRFPTRWGRRRVWLAISAPLVMISFWMLLVPPPDAGIWHVSLWLILLTLAWTMALTPYLAWGAEVSGDYAERARVTAWRECAALIGSIIAVIVYGAATEAETGMRNVALFVVAGLPLALLVSLSVTREPEDLSASRPPMREALQAMLANGPFLRLLAAYFINGAANALPAGLFLFFIGDYLGAPDAEWLLLIYFLCAAAGTPFWGWLAGRMPKHRVWGIAMIYASVIFLATPFLGEGDIWPFAVICVLTGLALGADLALPASIQADVVDLDTARSGAQRTGMFFAVWSVATKASLALAGGAALILLDLSGFKTGEANDPAALRNLALLYAVAPVGLKLIAVVLMWRFPLGREAQEDLRRQITREAV